MPGFTPKPRTARDLLNCGARCSIAAVVRSQLRACCFSPSLRAARREAARRPSLRA